MSEKMTITDRVDTPLSPSDLFALITDLDAVVPCVPGAILNPDETRADGARTGQIVIAFGPIRYRYDGVIHTRHVDPSMRRVTYEAAGEETSGEGTVGGELTLNVAEVGGGQSALEVLCEAQVTGMVADYGQDMAEDVASDIIRQFATTVGDRYERSQANASAGAEATPPPAETAKPIGGLRLLLRLTFQRILRKFKKPKASDSSGRAASHGSESSNT